MNVQQDAIFPSIFSLYLSKILDVGPTDMEECMIHSIFIALSSYVYR